MLNPKLKIYKGLGCRPLMFGTVLLRGFSNLILEKKDIQTMAPDLPFKVSNVLAMIQKSGVATPCQIQNMYFILSVFGIFVVEKNAYLPGAGVPLKLVCLSLCSLLEFTTLITFTPSSQYHIPTFSLDF